MSVTEFKAKCLELFDRLSKGALASVEVTRRGRTVAIVQAPAAAADVARGVHGSMAGRTSAAPDFDWTAPVLDEPLDSETGILHR